MGWRAWLRPLQRKAATNSYDLDRYLRQGGESLSGDRVTRETALSVTAVLAACRVNAEAIAALPLQVVRDGRPLPEHPLADLLGAAPNQHQSDFEFKEQLGYHLELMWDAYLWPIRVEGRVAEIYPLPPEWVEAGRDENWAPVYTVTLDPTGRRPRAAVTMGAGDLIHIRGATWDGVEGMDAIRTVRNALGLSMAAERHASRMFKAGTTLSGVLTTEQKLDEAAIARLKKQWDETYGGSGQAYKTPVLEQGLTFEALSMTAVDSQLIEARKFQIEEVARWSKTPAPLLGAGEKLQSFASVEQMMLFWLQHGVIPRCRRIERKLTLALLAPDERRGGLSIAFDTDELLRGDLSATAAFYSKALGAGGAPPWMTQNEVRSRLRLPERPEPWADELAKGTNPTAATNGDQNAPA